MSASLVVVSAGTYHLPFDRLSAWAEEWLRENPGVRLVMQHGPSAPVSGAENVEILPYSELLELCRAADAVVLQGGAGGVMDMRALGIVPIVVPRVPGGGEVVDDHQLVFSAEMAGLGIIRRALTAAELARLLDQSLSGEITPPGNIATPGADAVRTLLESPIRRAPWYAFIPRSLRSAGAIVAAKLRR
ncbi:glycosyltransferase [Microbacterium paraoxydans]|uniref:glycosyltransferase n=1 Tax=Microbacterium paraoxydans TaxID=199592 RepID=UPI001CFA96F6|nr:glycosyltransferase [Microbacterium paraoxydans]